MDKDSLPEDCDIPVAGVSVRPNQSECICNQPTATGDTENPAMPIPSSSSSASQLQSSSPSDAHTCPPHPPNSHPHPSPGNKLLSARPAPSKSGPAPFKADPAHIKEAAGDDLCLRCALSCVYCELISMCSTLEACLTCPLGAATCCCEAICCCCCGGDEEGMACWEEACQALVDCGLAEECCSSSGFMDFGLECCSFFFSA